MHQKNKGDIERISLLIEFYEYVNRKFFDGFGKTIISANEAHTNLNLFVMHSICEPP